MIQYSFINGPGISITNEKYDKFLVKFYSNEDGIKKYVYSQTINNNSNFGHFRQWFTNWYFEIYAYDEVDGIILYDTYQFDLKNKNVLIILDTDDEVDTNIWKAVCRKFEQKHSCNVTISDIEMTETDNFYASYHIGRYDLKKYGTDSYGNFEHYNGYINDVYLTYKSFRNPRDYKDLSPQDIACDILGLEHIDNIFEMQLYNAYNSITKKITNEFKINKLIDSVTCNFINGPFAEILGSTDIEYTIEFIDSDTQTVVHRDILKPNHWTRANRQWFTNWQVNVYTTELVYQHKYNAKDKKVYVHLSSESIGDTLAWFPYVEEFRKKHNCKMVCSTFCNEFFIEKYPNIEFVTPGTTVHGLYAMYEIGIYDDNPHRNRNDHKIIPLQQVAADMLGIEFKEIVPDISVKPYKHNINGKYVVISTDSTAQCKYWNHPGGWQKVVDYLNNLNYKVVVVQKGENNLKNVIDRTGKNPLSQAISILNDSEFVIGISSGIPWLAWALRKKVIMISGFTEPWYEFNENCYRIFNKHVCNGCWHKYLFDKGDWNWCPMKKNFECSSTILPEEVFTQIETVRNELDVFNTAYSDKKTNLTNNIIQFNWKDKSKFSDSDAMFHEIFRMRNYDFKNCKLKPGDTVVDIGANIGVFTRYAIANRAEKIYSFEPIKENYDLLIANSKGYNVICYNNGISDKHGIEKFHIDSTNGGHTILDTDPNNTRTGEIRDIECYSIDYLFENKIIPDKIDFMKIDTEGAEYQIMTGISDENSKKINKIAIEWHKFLYPDNSYLDKTIYRFADLGFQFYIDYNSIHLDTLYFWK